LNWAGEVPLETSTYVHKAKFDHFDQLIWEQDASGNQTRRTFSRSGHGQTVDHCEALSQRWVPFLAHTDFSADALPLRIVYGNGVTVESVLDERMRYLILQTTSRARNSGSLDIVEKISHTYDCEGRLIRNFDASKQEVFFRNCRILPEQTYTYDAIGQLISATGRGQLPTTAGKGAQLKPYGPDTGSNPVQGTTDGNQLYEYEESYQYDLDGNMTTMKHLASRDSSVSGWTRTYNYQEPSLLSDDPKIVGNRLSKTIVGSKEEKYEYAGPAGRIGSMTALSQYSRIEWNTDNMLSASSRQILHDGTPEMTYYVYDHTGTRVRKITEGAAGPGEVPRKQRDTLYLNGMELQIRLEGDGVQVRSTRRIAKVTGEKLLALVESVEGSKSPALIRYQIGKNLELDGSGQLISYEEYSPFGSVVYTAKYQDVEAPREYRFASYKHDSETGLYCCGARYLCAWLGRWMSPDPIGTEDGLNLYRYSGNDPVNFIDPGGMSRVPNPDLSTKKKSTGLLSKISAIFGKKNKTDANQTRAQPPGTNVQPGNNLNEGNVGNTQRRQDATPTVKQKLRHEKNEQRTGQMKLNTITGISLDGRKAAKQAVTTSLKQTEDGDLKTTGTRLLGKLEEKLPLNNKLSYEEVLQKHQGLKQDLQNFQAAATNPEDFNDAIGKLDLAITRLEDNEEGVKKAMTDREAILNKPPEFNPNATLPPDQRNAHLKNALQKDLSFGLKLGVRYTGLGP
jgi:RHS repeat-associated protein